MYITADIGGTNTRIGTSKNGRTFFAIEKFKTPARFEDGMQTISKTIAHFIKGQLPMAIKIAVAVPGSVEHAPGALRRLPNLPGWSNKPLAKMLSAQFHTTVQLVNDADAAGIGEAHRGAGRGYRKVAYYTISTGIGGARIINGVIDPKTPNYEPGHYTLIPGGRTCGCGRRGCLEAYGSGTGFYKTYGLRPENCKDSRIWDEYAQTLGQGIIKTLPHPLPDIIILGGGVPRVGARLFTPLRAYMKKNLRTKNPPPIVPAKLGDNAGLYGCLEILK